MYRCYYFETIAHSLACLLKKYKIVYVQTGEIHAWEKLR